MTETRNDLVPIRNFWVCFTGVSENLPLRYAMRIVCN